MNSKRIMLLYTLLTLLLIGSAVVLAQQVRHFMYERQDLTQQFRADVMNPEEIAKNIQQKEADNQKTILLTFSQTKSFKELATPVPVPSPTPIPPPSPTPVIPARGWLIDFATKQRVFFVAPDKSSVPAKIGETIKNNFGSDFTILEINADPDFPRVKVKDIQSGVVGEINQTVKK